MPIEDGPGWRLGFREVRDRAAADRLREAYLEIAVDRAAELAPGEAFWHEVVGADVIGAEGRSLGRVTDVYRAGEAEVYVVRGPRGDFDLPAVRSVITSFDPRGTGIVIDEAALDLEGPPVDAPAKPGGKSHRWSRHGKGPKPGSPTGDSP